MKLWLAMLLLTQATLQAGDWASNFGAAGANVKILATRIDATGNVYAAGYFDATTINIGNVTLRKLGVQDAFVAKFDTAGTILWAKNMGGAGATASSVAIAGDASGNVYALGNFGGANLTSPALSVNGPSDGFAIKLDASGTGIWAMNFGGAKATALGKSIAVDETGNVYIAGYFSGANLAKPPISKIGVGDAFAFKLTPSGAFSWYKNFGGSSASARAHGIVVDGAGNIYLAGDFDGSKLTSPALARMGAADAFLFRLNNAGTLLWSKSFGGANAVTTAQGLALDPAGNIYVGGSFNSASLSIPSLALTGSSDGFAFKLDASGATTWTQSFGGMGAVVVVQGIAADAQGKVAVGGYFLGAKLSKPILPLIGSSDAFAILLDETGVATWMQNFGGANTYTVGQGIGLDDAGNIYMGGAFNSASLFRRDVSLTTPRLTINGVQDAFLFKQTTQVTVPGAPTDVLATAADASATVSFVPPIAYGGSTIKGFTVVTDPPDGTDLQAGTIGLTHTIGGLINGRTYTFTVTASNVIGTGAASIASNSVTPKGAQSISFANPGAKTLGDVPFAVVLSSDAGLVVSLLSISPDICSVTGNIVTLAAAGTCSLAADQAGSQNFLAAKRVTQSFVVSKARQTVSFSNPGTQKIGTSTKLVSAASSGLAVTLSSLTPGICTVNGTTLSALAAGTCSINAMQAGDSTYAGASSVVQSFTIAKLEQVLTFATPAPLPLANGAFAVTPGSNANLPVTLVSTTPSICSVADNRVTPLAAGVCTLTASQAGNDVYGQATSITQSFTVSKSVQTISFTEPLPLTEGGIATLQASASSGLPIAIVSANPAICTVSGMTLTAVTTGICTLVASQSGNANFSPALDIQHSLTILAKGPALLIWSSDSLTFPETLIGASFSRSLTLTNTGGSNATLSGITAVGDFTPIGSCIAPRTLAPGESCSLLVAFSPLAAGIRTGSLTLQTTASISQSVINLSGTATSVTPTQQGACDGANTINFHALAIKDGDSKQFGQPLDILYCLRNFEAGKRVDLYIAVNVPGLGLLFLQSGGAPFAAPKFNGSASPYLANTTVPNLDGAVLSMDSVPASLPAGVYSFYALAIQPGKNVFDPANWIGNAPRADVRISN